MYDIHIIIQDKAKISIIIITTHKLKLKCLIKKTILNSISVLQYRSESQNGFKFYGFWVRVWKRFTFSWVWGTGVENCWKLFRVTGYRLQVLGQKTVSIFWGLIFYVLDSKYFCLFRNFNKYYSNDNSKLNYSIIIRIDTDVFY